MGALLRGIKKEQIRRGQVIIAPGSMKSVKKFQAQLYVRFCLFHMQPSLAHRDDVDPNKGRRRSLHSIYATLPSSTFPADGRYYYRFVLAGRYC